MEPYKHKILAIFLLLGIGLQAQTFDKKIKESFKVNNDVALVINSNHTDITIETWNRNEVAIEAVMEVEGVSKEEANNILENWEFEALGNSNKVKVTCISGNMNLNYAFEFDFPDDFPEFEFPEMPDFEEIEFDYEAYKTDSTYLKRYKREVQEQAEMYRNSDWRKKMDSIRKTEEYKRNIEEVKRVAREVKIEIRELQNSKEYREALEHAKIATEKATKEMMEQKEEIEFQTQMAKKAAKAAQQMLQEMKENGTFDSLKIHGENFYFNYGSSGNPNIKIRKSIKVKVPKNATFDLNVKHGKLKVPDSNKKMSATISYGDFIGGIIVGEKNELRFSNSEVEIETLNSGNVTLKNVPNATFGTFSNANLFSNSSDVLIKEIGKNADVSHKFGNLEINKTSPNFNSFNLILDYSKASVNISDTNFVYQTNNKKSTINLSETFNTIEEKNSDGVQFIEGYYNNKSSLNKLFLTAVYSTVDLK